MSADFFLGRSLQSLQNPPPWIWLWGGCLWQRLGNAPLWRLPLEVIQQLQWWLVRPWLRPRRRPKGFPVIPWPLTLWGCWLNSYTPFEVARWWVIGVRRWKQLAQHTPDSLACAVHARRRRHWPDQCHLALQLLGDKAALLARTPECWQAPYVVLQPPPFTPQSNPEDDGYRGIPAWWWDALAAEGIVLKPQSGHAGRAVVRFRYTGSELEQQGLFWRLSPDAPSPTFTTPPEPQQLFAHWHRLCGTREPALASPYLAHSPELPATEPSVVVRVITARASPAAPIAVREAWLEVPFGEGAVVFISPYGISLPNLGEPLAMIQQDRLQEWQVLLKTEAPSCVRACLEAAVAMHDLLPPIDQVAWDWIPAHTQPLLLEGNGKFGLLAPQLFEQLISGAGKP